MQGRCRDRAGAAFHLTVEGASKKAVVKEACQVCLAFMLVVAPRKVVLHLNALAHGEASKQALIDAGLAVQTELGPPVSGTYRDRFHGDEAPRIDLGDTLAPEGARVPSSLTTTGPWQRCSRCRWSSSTT